MRIVIEYIHVHPPVPFPFLFLASYFRFHPLAFPFFVHCTVMLATNGREDRYRTRTWRRFQVINPDVISPNESACTPLGDVCEAEGGP